MNMTFAQRYATAPTLPACWSARITFLTIRRRTARSKIFYR